MSRSADGWEPDPELEELLADTEYQAASRSVLGKWGSEMRSKLNGIVEEETLPEAKYVAPPWPGEGPKKFPKKRPESVGKNGRKVYPPVSTK